MNERKIICLLKEAYDSFFASDMESYSFHLAKTGEAVSALPKKGSLYGEWVLVSSQTDMTNPDALCEKYREARRYIERYSIILPRHAEMFGEYYHPFALCNPVPGHAEENAGKLTEAVRLFSSLTGGGMGTDICYRGQLALYRGDFSAARVFALEALETAGQGEQEITALAAADTLAGISKHEQDRTLWNYAYSYIHAVAKETRPAGRVCREQAQILDTTLLLSLGVVETLPDFMTEDILAVSTPWGCRMYGDTVRFGSLANALMAQMEYHLYSGNPVKALNLADMQQKVYGISNLLTDSYLDFLRAGAYGLLRDMTQMKAALLRGMERIAQCYSKLRNHATKPYLAGRKTH